LTFLLKEHGRPLAGLLDIMRFALQEMCKISVYNYVFLDVTLFNLVEVHTCFRGMYYCTFLVEE
jgi:hypothetical protein